MFGLLFFLFYASHALAQAPPAYSIDSFAGSDALVDGSTASLAVIGDTRAIALNARGTLYFSDSTRHRVLRIETDGTLHVVAGTGTAGLGAEGVQANASPLNQPYGIALDSMGNIYIADLGNARVRKVTADGRIQTIAGGGSLRPSTTAAPATDIELKAPRNVTVDGAGNVYIADFLDHRVLRVSSDRLLQVVAGTGTAGPNTESAPATQATLSYPAGLAVDASGLYIADSGNHVIRKLTSGTMTTLRFQDVSGFLNLPTGLCVDSAGNLFIASSGFGQALRVNRAGAVTVVAQEAKDVAVDAAGNLYIAAGAFLRKLTPAGVLTTLAGTGGTFRGEGATASLALLNQPSDVKMDSGATLYIADTKNHRIRKIQSGIISTVAGDGNAGFQGDQGPALNARLSSPQGIAIDRAGNLYVADTGNHRVRRITPDGRITTVAGTGTAGLNGDVKLALEAQLNGPTAVAVDPLGQVHIADTGNHRVRRLLASGYLVTLSGNGQRELDSPRGLAFDTAGNLYIADSGHHRIQKIAANGVITTAVSAGLNTPVDVAVDNLGSLLVTDAADHVVRTIAPGGAPQVIAGTGTRGFSGDAGPALQAKLDEPSGIAIASDGAIYIADKQNHRIRKLAPGAAVTPPAVERPPDIRVLHAATLGAAPLAPGMLISVQATGIGPATAQSGVTGANGALETSLAGTEVRFDGRPAPILYAQHNLVNAQVPYRLSGQPLVLVEVLRDGKVQGSSVLEVAAHSPGIFTSGGTGQTTAVNDDYTLNAIGSGAARGSVLTFYATGEGMTNPAAIDGKLSDAPYPTPQGQVEVTIGGHAADVVSMGCAVTSPGVLQLSVRVPTQAAAGVQPIVLKVAGVPSQRNATIVVK